VPLGCGQRGRRCGERREEQERIVAPGALAEERPRFGCDDPLLAPGLGNVRLSRVAGQRTPGIGTRPPAIERIVAVAPLAADA
jgi:hypothetical protein